MPEQQEDLRAIVYPTLWQPMMIKGVPRDWGIFSLIASAFGMVIAGWLGLRWYQFYGIGLAVVLIGIGWLAAKFDPEFFSITIVRSKIGKTKGGGGGNEYLA